MTVVYKTKTYEEREALGVPVETIVMFKPKLTGCSSHSCIFQDNTKGIGTNGGCRCESELVRSREGFKAIQTIHFLRGQLIKYDTNSQ